MPAARSARGDALFHATAAVVVAVAVGIATCLVKKWLVAPAVGYSAGVLVYLIAVWRSVDGMDADTTREHAGGEVPSTAFRQAVVIVSTVLAIASVVLLIIDSHGGDLYRTATRALLGLAVVAIAWALVHTIFMLRYAWCYYDENPGLDFNQKDPPSYRDFAYVSFSIGTTAGITDVVVTDPEMRRIVFVHSLYSFLYNTVITASLINVLVSLF